ncbi:amidohydrolase [Zhouia amylolytica]|uniref:Amidohydrolase n=1 Tax=Zhouia amylolytica AD3 TaxID=1286632 RepID=W2UU10_9FLAO|nr:amidohydrolase [Zhouia amylolytica]ETN96807.1 amidohydrolase [Zhouia amylolytica AD3]
MKKICLLFLAFAMSCTKKEKIDLLVTNANIYTVDSAFSKAEAMAVKNGKIMAVGLNEELTEIYESQRILDAKGKTILPGLIDAHCHFFGLGLNQQMVDLLDTKSYEEVLQKVVAFQKEKQKDFIFGRGWDQNDWEEKIFPNKDRLDKLFPDTPVVLQRIDGHAYLVNQKALDLAGITKETKVSGGEIVIEDGALTGVLIDNPMAMIDAIVPDISRADQAKALLDAQALCLDFGLTTVSDAGLDREVIELIDSLQQQGDLKMRVYAMVSNNKENLDFYLPKGIIKTDHLNVRSVKVYGDGALGSRGAALKEEYSDKHHHFGAMVTSVDEIHDLATRIAASDYQMNTHAIGDSANAVVLKAYEAALTGKSDRRWRIEHAQVIDGEDFNYFSKGIIPSVQPTHATSDMYWAEDRLGEDRIERAYAYKTLLNKSGVLALGTDFPVEKVSPFLTFYAAVARKDLEDYPKNGFQIKDALTREETLKGMTIWAAFANFEEQEKGSLEPGKFADFIILDKDIMQVPIEEVPDLQVEHTYLGGELMPKKE